MPNEYNILSFRDFFLTEALWVRDENNWEIMHRDFWSYIERSAEQVASRQFVHDTMVEDREPDFEVVGTTAVLKFYTFRENNRRKGDFEVDRVMMKELPEGDDEGAWFYIHDADIQLIKEWWKDAYDTFV